MSFLTDLLRWFWGGKNAKNTSISQPGCVSVPSASVDEFKLPSIEESPLKLKKDLDLTPRLTSSDVLGDLQSLQSLTQQFDRARQDLVTELQKLAPPKKRNPFWDKDA